MPSIAAWASLPFPRWIALATSTCNWRASSCGCRGMSPYRVRPVSTASTSVLSFANISLPELDRTRRWNRMSSMRKVYASLACPAAHSLPAVYLLREAPYRWPFPVWRPSSGITAPTPPRRRSWRACPTLSWLSAGPALRPAPHPRARRRPSSDQTEQAHRWPPERAHHYPDPGRSGSSLARWRKRGQIPTATGARPERRSGATVNAHNERRPERTPHERRRVKSLR